MLFCRKIEGNLRGSVGEEEGIVSRAIGALGGEGEVGDVWAVVGAGLRLEVRGGSDKQGPLVSRKEKIEKQKRGGSGARAAAGLVALLGPEHGPVGLLLFFLFFFFFYFSALSFL
jgi:hypothetical protein